MMGNHAIVPRQKLYFQTNKTTMSVTPPKILPNAKITLTLAHQFFSHRTIITDDDKSASAEDLINDNEREKYVLLVSPFNPIPIPLHGQSSSLRGS
jgi:hypothetical protein